MTKIVPVILAGGNGTRLWPLSTATNPKQFNEEIISPSLFQRTCTLTSELRKMFEKDGVIESENIEFLPTIVVTSCEYEHLALPFQKYYSTLILEPASKNTTYAILSACLVAYAHYGYDVTVLVLPSDHIITDCTLFAKSISNGMKFTGENIVTFGVKPLHPETGYGYIVTFGVKPLHPETGYGYIEAGKQLAYGTFKVHQFKEKPNVETAQEFVKSEDCYWNSGIFLLKAGNYVDICNNFLPHDSNLAKESLKNAKINVNGIQQTIALSQEFTRIEGNSIDYAILENEQNIVMTEMLSPWNDIGSFQLLHKMRTTSSNLGDKISNNSLHGNIQAVDSIECFLHNSTNAPLVVHGMEGLAVIQTNDATLVMPLTESQNVKTALKSILKNEANNQNKVQRTWGSYEILHQGLGFKIKRLLVNPHSSLSLQSHEHRSEHWVVVRGVASIMRDGIAQTLECEQSVYIPQRVRHRLTNDTDSILEVIEIQTGVYLEESDIVRY